jgi:hypothetical protein
VVPSACFLARVVAMMSSEKQRDLIDRKVSVAPMMDWADDLRFLYCIKELTRTENPCRLYVASNFGLSHLPLGALFNAHEIPG